MRSVTVQKTVQLVLIEIIHILVHHLACEQNLVEE